MVIILNPGKATFICNCCGYPGGCSLNINEYYTNISPPEYCLMFKDIIPNWELVKYTRFTKKEKGRL